MKFSNLRAQSKAQNKTDYTNYITIVQNYVSSNPKFFWHFIQNRPLNSLISNIVSYNDLKFVG